MLKNIFKKKSKKEKELIKLEKDLSNLIAKRNFLTPKTIKRVFKEDKYEIVPTSRVRKVEDLDKEIMSLKERINKMKIKY